MTTNPSETSTPAETAVYIGGISRELKTLAQKADLGFLSYLLAMVAEEAETAAQRLRDGRSPRSD